jgi:hypothetical protein
MLPLAPNFLRSVIVTEYNLLAQEWTIPTKKIEHEAHDA